MRAKDLMTTPVWSCSEQESLARAAQIMWESDCGCLPVTDASSRVIGMITDRDICMAAYTRGTPLGQSTVQSAMSRNVISCAPDDSVGTVEELMRSWQIRRLPVLDQGHLAGMITIGDLVRSTQTSAVRGTLAAPGVLKTMASITEKRAGRAAAE